MITYTYIRNNITNGHCIWILLHLRWVYVSIVNFNQTLNCCNILRKLVHFVIHFWALNLSNLYNPSDLMAIFIDILLHMSDQWNQLLKLIFHILNDLWLHLSGRIPFNQTDVLHVAIPIPAVQLTPEANHIIMYTITTYTFWSLDLIMIYWWSVLL